MKKTALSFIIISSISVSSCAPVQPVVGYTEVDHMIVHDEGNREGDIFPDGYSLFAIGRAISDNSVDIFDPWLTTLNLPQDAPEYADPLRNYPQNGYILIADRGVTVFSLSSESKPEGDDFSRVVDSLAPPVPLIEEEPLAP